MTLFVICCIVLVVGLVLGVIVMLAPERRPLWAGPRRTMTAQEFLEGYAQRSNLTVEELVASGRRVYPCHCGDASCPGWAMQSEELMEMGRQGGVPMVLGSFTSDVGYEP